MKVVEKVAQLQQAITAANAKYIGFVPTMGALHAGHTSLVDSARAKCDVVVVSIFVNPTQFNDKNDLKNYPRTLESDLALLEKAGADIVFTPTIEDIYPQQDTRVFNFGQLDKVMEGAHRPGHFNGVAQVVSRLFEIVKPNISFFGEKDFQQLAIIRELVRTTNTPVEIVGCPIKRDQDGLALSSRNILLSPTQREAAPRIYRTLSETAELSSKMEISQLKEYICKKINENSELETEYFEVVDALTLQPVNNWEESDDIYGCIAVKIGAIRLIDNIKIK